MLVALLLFLGVVVSAANSLAENTASCCNEGLHFPSITGVHFLTKSIGVVANFSIDLGQSANVGFLTTSISDISFCNVTLSYTHPGQNDLITVSVALPLDSWNGRFVAAGGGGWVTGYFSSQAGPLAAGYASAFTDGGHGSTVSPAIWGLISPGNINYANLVDFSSLALAEMVQIGKAVTKQYYQMAPKYSYWSGCSTGGRQGLMVAQRYPKLLDGILAVAPAINWASFLVAEYWPQLVMNKMNSYPQPCEFEAITAAAIAACDGLDGVVDGIISAPELCKFKAASVAGQTRFCDLTGQNITISHAATKIAQQTWNGAVAPDGSKLWYGLDYSANLTLGLAGTTCANSDGTNCTGRPFPIPPTWMSVFVKKNANFDPLTLSHKQYTNLFHASVQQFDSIISANYPDLSAFKSHGGKMITWHGGADQLIFPGGTSQYYSAVEAGDPHVRDYYRYFVAPGLAHCTGGDGFFPTGAFGALVNWVEEGVAPEVLEASTLFRGDGEVWDRPLCLWPLVARFVGGDPRVATSFVCAEAH